MPYRSYKITTIGILILTMAACAGRSKTDVVQTPPENKAQMAAAEMDRQIVTTINFSQGQKTIDDSTANEIDKAIREARARGEVDSVDVVVWSDMNYPRKGEKLPKKEVDLAADRAKTLANYIDQEAPSASVKTYNMAEQPSALGRWANTRDAKVKSKLSSLGMANDDGEVPSVETASKALVMIKVK